MKDYHLLPHTGFGKAKFGMPIADDSELIAAYGEIRTIQPHIAMAFSEEQLIKFRNYMTEEQIAQLVESTNRHNQRMANITDIYYKNSNLSLTYDENGLYEIQISSGVEQTNFENHLFFIDNPVDFLIALEKENGEPALVKDQDCVFKNLNVYIWSAFEYSEHNTIRFHRDGEELAGDKSIMIGSRPRNIDEEFEGYVSISFQDLTILQ